MKKYINKYDVIIEVLDEDSETITYKIGKGNFYNYECVKKEIFNNIIKVNGYKEMR